MNLAIVVILVFQVILVIQVFLGGLENQVIVVFPVTAEHRVRLNFQVIVVFLVIVVILV